MAFAILNRFKKGCKAVIRTDMILYSFFKRASIYPFFIFALFFGKKGCTALLHPLLFILRLVCFYGKALVKKRRQTLSWYLAMTSILLFVIFPVKKRFCMLTSNIGLQ